MLDPEDLWNAGTNTAELATNWGDPSAYVHGFLDAASKMAAGMQRTEGPIDITIYPAIYLLRHGVEIGIKALLATYHWEEHDEIKAFTGHVLADLWNQLRPQLDGPSYQDDSSHLFQEEEIRYVEKVVFALHEIDPTGEAARYDTSNKGGQTLAGLYLVNLDVLAEVCEQMQRWITGVLDHRLEATSFLSADFLKSQR